MKKDNGLAILAGFLVLCSFVVVIYSGVRDGSISTNTIILALKLIIGFIVVFWVSTLTWFAWVYLKLSREDKEKVKGEQK